MHHYGRQAMAHWQRWLPTRYAQIPDPQTFFTDLGEQVAGEIVDLAQQLADQEPTQAGYLANAGRLTNARMRAEEIVLRDRVLLTPEPGVDPDPTTSP